MKVKAADFLKTWTIATRDKAEAFGAPVRAFRLSLASTEILKYYNSFGGWNFRAYLGRKEPAHSHNRETLGIPNSVHKFHANERNK